MNTRAQWITGIPDLYGDLETAQKHKTVPQVSERTGFSPTTITDLLSREPITSATNPLGALSRPAARIGTNPYYSDAQIEECLRRRNAATDVTLGGGYTPLPKVTAAEAEKRGLLSVTEIADLAKVHEQTIRRWKSREAGFPPPVALRERDEDGHSGVPFVVHEGAAVRAWLRDRKPRSRTTRRGQTGKPAVIEPDAVAV